MELDNNIKAIRNVLILLAIVLGFGFIYGFDVDIVPNMTIAFLLFYVIVHIDLTGKR